MQNSKDTWNKSWVTTLYITFHHIWMCCCLDLLLCSRWTLDLLKIEIKHLTWNLLDESKAWTTSAWPRTSQLTNGPWFYPLLKYKECFHTHHPRVMAFYEQLSERSLPEDHWAKPARGIVKLFQQRWPRASLSTFLENQWFFLWMNEYPHL